MLSKQFKIQAYNLNFYVFVSVVDAYAVHRSLDTNRPDRTDYKGKHHLDTLYGHKSALKQTINMLLNINGRLYKYLQFEKESNRFCVYNHGPPSVYFITWRDKWNKHETSPKDNSPSCCVISEKKNGKNNNTFASM